MPDAGQASGRRVLTGVIVVGFGVMLLSSSIKGAYQVYFRDLADGFELGRAQFALTGALFGIALGILSPVVGSICDRHGPYRCMLSGALMAALAFLLLGLFQSYAVFMVAYGLMAAYALAAMTFVPMGVWVDRVFSRRHKGLAYAAVSNGVAIGFILLSPLWVWLNAWLAWSGLALLLALMFVLLVALPLAWASRRLPMGRETNDAGGDSADISLLEHLGRPLFVLLAISFAGCGASMAFIDLHFVPLMQERLALTGGMTAPSTVAVALSVLGVFELAGALAVGYRAGRARPALLLALLYGVRALAMIMLALSQSAMGFVVFAAVFGATYMGTVILTSMLCLQCYGPRIKGKMFGLLFTVHQVAVFLTAYLGGLARDQTGDYTTTALAVAGICLASVLAAFALHPALNRDHGNTTGDLAGDPPLANQKASGLEETMKNY